MAKGTTVKMWRRTMGVLIGLIVVGFGAILFSLIRIQLVNGSELKQAAVDQQLKDTVLTAQRGTIYDANKKVLATSATVWKVVLEPNSLSKKDEYREQKQKDIVEGLAKILDMEEEELWTAIQKNSYYVIVKRQVETDVKDEILALKEELASTDRPKELRISGVIRLEEDYKRYYPYKTLASSVLGFTGSDGHGLEGLEAYYNEYLTGTAGRMVTAQNAVGTDMPFQYEQLVDAQDGYDLVLTIDETVQHILEKYLDEGVVNNQVANRATGIIMNVKTGEILAMAVSGDYDPNNPFTISDPTVQAQIDAITDEEKKSKALGDARTAQWRNKAISDTYYPGSVFKMVTLSMALEENLVNENTTFTCTGSFIPFQGEKPIHCWKRAGHGLQNIVEATCNSCNPLFIHLGQLLGEETFIKYFEAFGFGEKTGIDLPGEASSIYKDADSMNPVDLAVYAFGQNFSITPIQMVTAASVIANGGYLVQPHVVSQVLDSDGNIVETADTSVKRQVISEDVAKRVRAILQTNATTGTAKNGYVAGYRIAGKTGTSQKVADFNTRKANAEVKLKQAQEIVVSDGPNKEAELAEKNRKIQEAKAELDAVKMRYIASYCGFAPADDPEIAMLIFFDEPMGENYYGGSVAGPVFSKVMTEVLPYLGVEPQYTEEELAKMDGVTPDVLTNSVAQAESTIKNEGYTPKVYGDGETVLAQIPEPGDTIPKGGTVVLFTDENSQSRTVTVPSLTGMTRSQVNQAAASAGIQVSMTGAAMTGGSVVSSTQSIAAGEKVKPGTVISVNFIEVDQVG